jgi:sigma-B regulation protein RsbU (phosphoserine phosphatase)
MATMALGSYFSTLELFKYREPPEKITNLLNSLVNSVSPLGYYVTAVLFYVDFSSQTLEIHNCGFSPVLAFKPLDNNKLGFKALAPAMSPLGIADTIDLTERQILPIVKDLRICAYSDGLTDMTSASGSRFGEDRAGTFIKAMHTRSQDEIGQCLAGEIRRWTGEASLADDLTLMDLRFL